MPEVEVWTTVDVELDDFDTDDLKEELERRGLGADIHPSTATELITSIYQKRRLGKDYQLELEQLIYQTIGKIV
jgi:signal recognition particle GTPase